MVEGKDTVRQLSMRYWEFGELSTEITEGFSFQLGNARVGKIGWGWITKGLICLAGKLRSVLALAHFTRLLMPPFQ